MILEQNSQFIEITIEDSDESREETLRTLTYFLQDVVSDLLDGAIYNGKDGATIQLYGQGNIFFMEYINRTPQKKTFVSYNLSKLDRKKMYSIIDFSSWGTEYHIERSKLISYKEIIEILEFFISSYNKESFLEDLLKQFNITHAKFTERLENGKIKHY